MIEENYEYFGEFDDPRDAAAFQFRSNDSSSYYDDRPWNGSFRWNGSRRHSWPEESRLHNLTVALNTYALPVILLMGIVGNSVSLLVYVWTPRLCRQSSSVYLAFLSAVDNVSLVFVFTIWFNWIDIPIFHKNGWCHTVQFCTYVCSFLSAWTVVSFTCERWIVVFRPLRRHRMCTRRRAVVVMTSLTVGSMVFYSFSFVTTQVQYVNDNPVCTNIADYILAQNVVRSIDTTLTVIIPVIVIVFMNVGIGLKICRYTSNRNQESNPGTPSAGEEAFTSNISSQHRCSFESRSRQAVFILQTGGVSSSVARGGAAGGSAIIPRTAPAAAAAGNNKNLRLCTRRHHTQLRITRALFIVSSLFVVLNLPSYVFRVHALVISLRRETHLDYMGYIWQEFLQFIYYINFSSRFFLYLSCSRHFRYAINRFVCKFKKR